jgi:hypothetical protein
MKILLIVNLVFVGLLVGCCWTFRFFAFGAFVHPVGLAIGILCGVAWMPLLLCVPVMFLVNIYGIFKYWSKHKLVTLVPFLVLGIAVASLFAWNVRKMSVMRFKKYLPDYTEFVSKLEKEHKKGECGPIAVPKEYSHLGYWCAVYDDEPNNVYVSFCVGHFGVFGHTAFVYTSGGEIVEGSKTYREWPYRQRVNENWFRVSD